MKRPENCDREYSGEIASVGRHGVVRSVSAVRSAWNMKQRSEQVEREVVEASGCPFEREANSPKGEKNGALPLSLGNNTYLTACVETCRDSMVADLGRPPVHRWERNDQKQGKRGKITRFSSASQRRLMRRVAQVEKGQPCHFISLTFPVDVTAQEAKRFLRTWWKRLIRKFNKAGKRIGTLWKMEAQKSGRWHFHLMIFGAKFIPAKWAKFAWMDVIGAHNVKGAFDRGVDIRFVDGNMEALKAYVCKYFSKDEGDLVDAYLDENLGRVWGVMGDLPVNEVVKIDMTVRELVWLWRLHSRKAKRNVTKLSPVLFSNSPPIWVENARKLAML